MDDFKKHALIGSGIIAGSFLIFWIVVSLFSGKLNAVAGNIIAERQLAAERSYALDNLSTLKKQAPVADTVQVGLDSLLPHEDGLLSFPSFMEALARAHAIDLSFAFSGQPVAGQPGYLAFTATVTGSAGNIQSFLRDLELRSMKFLVNTDSVNFTSQGDTYRADITGKVFFQ